MVLANLSITVRYPRLLKVLKVQSGVGASIYNLRYLSEIDNSLSIQVIDGDMDMLGAFLLQGCPVIAAVNTIDLPYWADEVTYHAVIVVGMDDTKVWLHDPWFEDAPKEVDRIKFESAWLRREYACAIVQQS